MNKKKTLAIGIDGASWNYVTPLLEAGRLPNLSQLIENGHKGTLKSTIPPFSPVAWSSFMTGKNPDNHGIFDWCKRPRDGQTYRPVSAVDRKAAPFWHYLNNAGMRVGIFNIPLTYPAEAIDGFYISGFDSPSENINKYYPKDIPQIINEKFGWDHLRLMPPRLYKTREDRLTFLSQYEQCCDKQTTMALFLIDKYRIDVLAMNYSINDHFSHYMKEYEFVEKGLEIADRNLGRLIQEYPDANFIILSDHGSTRIKGVFLIYNWLRDNGYVTFNNKKLEIVKLRAILADIFKKSQGKNLYKRILIKALVTLAKLLPVMIVAKLVQSLSKNRDSVSYWPHNAIDDEPSSVAFCSMGSLGLYINDKYERRGFSSQERKDLCDELIRRLLPLKDPVSGMPLFDRIIKREEIYHNSLYIEDCPDLFLHASAPYSIWISHLVADGRRNGDAYFYDSDRIDYYGRHIDDGIFIFSGKDFNRESDITDLNIADIPAVILHLSNVPIPNDFNGKVHENLYSTGFREKNKLGFQNSHLDRFWKEREQKSDATPLSSDEENEIKDKLSGLGYM